MSGVPSKTVVAMIRAFVQCDFARFKALSLQVAARMPDRAAADVRYLIGNRDKMPDGIPQQYAHLADMLTPTSLDELILQPKTQVALGEIISELQHASEILEAGLTVSRCYVFEGPSGTGKTHAARSIGAALGLPTCRVSGVRESYVGQTSKNLSMVAELVRSLPAVYLIDEVDVLAGKRLSARGSGADVEVNATTSAMLILLDVIADSNSVFVGTTNFDGELDVSFKRRVETVEFPRLGIDDLRKIAARFDVPEGVLLEESSPAEFRRAAERYKKRQIIGGFK